jgi:uncharacterized RDD family membrane protein YckC
MAPVGRPLTDLVKRDEPLTWAQTRPILEQLARELIAGERDSTLPSGISVGQVFVGQDGAVQLLDWPLVPVSDGNLRSVELLQHVAKFALEGKPADAEELTRPVHAPVPEHARPLLLRLMDKNASLDEFVASLEATRDRPRRVDFSRKLAYLWVLFVGHAFGLLLMFAPGFALAYVTRSDPTNVSKIAEYFWDVQTEGPQTKLYMVGTLFSTPVLFWPMAWAFWAFCFRGGFTHSLTGLRLVRQDGRPASRWQCALRALIIWMPIALLLLTGTMLKTQLGVAPELADTFMWAAVGLLGAYCYLSLLYPARSLLDWLAGTWLVPD